MRVIRSFKKFSPTGVEWRTLVLSEGPLVAKGLRKTMPRLGSNKPVILQARVIELSAQGVSGRKIAQELNINRRTVASSL
jgi:DNA-binding NarL/FixJ family response regulator